MLTARSDIFRCRSIETFASMGPRIRTDLTEDDVAAGLEISVRVNGETCAWHNTRDHRHRLATGVLENRLVAG